MVETVSDASALWLSPNTEPITSLEESPELWMAPDFETVDDDGADNVESPASKDGVNAIDQTWYFQFCFPPGSPYCQCVNECGGFNFVRPKELPSSSLDSVAAGASLLGVKTLVEDIGFKVTVDVSQDQLALLSRPMLSTVLLSPQSWQTNYAPSLATILLVRPTPIPLSAPVPSIAARWMVLRVLLGGSDLFCIPFHRQCVFALLHCSLSRPPHWEHPQSAVVEEEEEEEGKLPLPFDALHLHSDSDNSKSFTSA